MEDLDDNTRREIRAMSPATLRFVMHNALVRARSCVAVEGQHLRDIIIIISCANLLILSFR